MWRLSSINSTIVGSSSTTRILLILSLSLLHASAPGALLAHAGRRAGATAYYLRIITKIMPQAKPGGSMRFGRGEAHHVGQGPIGGGTQGQVGPLRPQQLPRGVKRQVAPLGRGAAADRPQIQLAQQIGQVRRET